MCFAHFIHTTSINVACFDALKVAYFTLHPQSSFHPYSTANKWGNLGEDGLFCEALNENPSQLVFDVRSEMNGETQQNYSAPC